MSISGIERERELALKRARAYVPITLFCLAFGWIYESYSFGVYSNCMIYAFMFPLVGGVAFWLYAGTARRRLRCTRLFTNCQAASIATFTVGSIFKGILDIYGTTSALTGVYWIAGGVLAVIAAVLLLAVNIRER